MPTLYRFFSAKTALLTIETKQLRIGRITALNDPFDCSFHIVGDTPFEEETGEKIVKELVADRNDSYGLICFGRTWSEPVMWSHYADHHRGIALVFAFKKAREDLWPVKYQTKRTPIEYKALRDPLREKEVQRKLKRSNYVKSKTWEYEREVRILPPLDRCSMNGGSYYLPIEPGLFRGVILGLRCPETVADVRRTCAHAGFTDARVWRAVKSRDGFSLTREEV